MTLKTYIYAIYISLFVFFFNVIPQAQWGLLLVKNKRDLLLLSITCSQNKLNVFFRGGHKQCVGKPLKISPTLRCSTPLGSFLFLRVCVRQNCVCVCVCVCIYITYILCIYILLSFYHTDTHILCLSLSLSLSQVLSYASVDHNFK